MEGGALALPKPEGAPQVAFPPLHGKGGLGAAEAGAPEGVDHGDAGLGAEGEGQILGLVEAPGEAPQPVQRDRHQGVDVGREHRELRMAHDEAGQRLGKIALAAVFETGDKGGDFAGIIGSGDNTGERILFPALF